MEKLRSRQKVKTRIGTQTRNTGRKERIKTVEGRPQSLPRHMTGSELEPQGGSPIACWSENAIYRGICVYFCV